MAKLGGGHHGPRGWIQTVFVTRRPRAHKASGVSFLGRGSRCAFSRLPAPDRSRFVDPGKKQATAILRAPALLSAAMQARMVAPLVNTSSTSTMSRPAILSAFGAVDGNRSGQCPLARLAPQPAKAGRALLAGQEVDLQFALAQLR